MDKSRFYFHHYRINYFIQLQRVAFYINQRVLHVIISVSRFFFFYNCFKPPSRYTYHNIGLLARGCDIIIEILY